MGNLLEKELRIMIVKMIQDLRKRMVAQSKKMQEILNKELDDIKKQSVEQLNNENEKYTRKNRRINEAVE